MKQTVRLAGAELKEYRHVCAFFHTPDELYATLLPFIKEGLEQRQKAFHIIDPEHRAEHFQRLRTAGIDAGRRSPAPSAQPGVKPPSVRN